MREFFRGWRRKVGIVLLGLACAVFGMWMRSRVVYDAISFGTGHQQQAVFSVSGSITWWSYSLTTEKPYNHIGSRAFNASEAAQIEASTTTTKSLLMAGNNLRELSCPYWLLAGLLTLLSAFLLLPQPWKKETVKSTGQSLHE